MKQLKFLILLIAVLLGTSCSKIKFDEDGSPYVKGSGVSENTYLSEICGYGWKIVSEKHIRDNGTVEKENVWEKYYGIPGAHLYFEKDFTIKYFYSPVHLLVPSFKKFPTYFNDSDLYDLDAKVDWPQIRIVSVDSEELVLITRFGWPCSLCKYRRMTKSELEEYQKTYIHEEQ